MPKLDFFTKKFGEETVLKRAQKQAKNPALQRTIEILYFEPYATDEDIAQVLSDGTTVIDPTAVRLQLRPQAKQLIEQERAKNNVALTPAPTVVTEVTPEAPGNTTVLAETSIDSLQAQAVGIVMSAHSGVTINAKIKTKVIFLFKTFAPLAVLFLTIPESYWVFTHLYAGEFAQDKVLPILTGVFAVLVDFGYLYLTVLLEMNKEAMFKRRRAGLEVEGHEKHAVHVQSALWWLVAGMDVLAQFVFLYSATHNSTFFSATLVTALAGVRVFSLFLTMFVVSFAGTELMTDVDVVANEQIERAEKVSRVLSALGTARQKEQKAKIELENMIADQDFRRENERYMKEMYADARENAREDARRAREELRKKTVNADEPKRKL
ncbi:hypothetical protein KDW_30530 [Dictyobacter vulcani]|uniref:Uncharacterized protein n=1 Tax=Dictyobacter vulcani TaxID=2607529 RepID=A0A5J4KR54_9CHLR|nr:hypothetical protein [Dictyobacter vulcani]GER88891.1 hypothetical protein KDW_30530 [Dictyobacter vulcani]